MLRGGRFHGTTPRPSSEQRGRVCPAREDPARSGRPVSGGERGPRAPPGLGLSGGRAAVRPRTPTWAKGGREEVALLRPECVRATPVQDNLDRGQHAGVEDRLTRRRAKAPASCATCGQWKGAERSPPGLWPGSLVWALSASPLPVCCVRFQQRSTCRAPYSSHAVFWTLATGKGLQPRPSCLMQAVFLTLVPDNQSKNSEHLVLGFGRWVFMISHVPLIMESADQGCRRYSAGLGR